MDLSCSIFLLQSSKNSSLEFHLAAAIDFVWSLRVFKQIVYVLYKHLLKKLASVMPLLTFLYICEIPAKFYAFVPTNNFLWQFVFKTFNVFLHVCKKTGQKNDSIKQILCGACLSIITQIFFFVIFPKISIFYSINFVSITY